MTDNFDHSATPLQGDAAPPSRSFNDTARVTGEVARVTVGGVNPSGAMDNASFKSSDLAPRDATKGIVSTARSSHGRALAGAEVKPGSLVTIEGVETPISTAVALGLV